MRLNKILVFTDGSKDSMPAGDFAATLARALGARVELLTVVPGFDEILMEFTKPSGKQADEAVARIGRVHLDATLSAVDFSGVDVDQVIRIGRPAVEVVIRAESIKPDLLVFGGRGPESHYILSHAPCPVTVMF